EGCARPNWTDHKIWADRPIRRWNVPRTDQHVVQFFRLQPPPVWLYYFPFGFLGMIRVKITSSMKNHRKPVWPAVRRRRTRPPSFGVSSYAHTRGRLYPPVIYRQPMTVPLSPARRSRRNDSPEPSCRTDLHLG